MIEVSSFDFSKLIIATNNIGKLREFEALLVDLPLVIAGQPQDLDVDESGNSFAANARIKAVAAALATGEWALADDSGLSVNALNGAPGIYSARYANTDSERINRLLIELEQAQLLNPEFDRAAQFVAALALSDPSGRVVLEVEGCCNGEILKQPIGEGGFGYDPIFLVPELTLSYAQLDKETKALVGHRGKAFARLLPELQELLSINPAAM
jgi:XTP/dITP diphosphohydrolase